MIRPWLLAGVTFAFLMAIPKPSRAGTGKQVFNSICAMCHQIDGQGVPGEFPRIAGRADEIARTTGGREYLCTLVLYGMFGKITVDGTPLVGVMPPFGTLTNQQLADALNYVMQLAGKSTVRPFTASEIKAQRRPAPLAGSAVHAMRTRLVRSGAIP